MYGIEATTGQREPRCVIHIPDRHFKMQAWDGSWRANCIESKSQP